MYRPTAVCRSSLTTYSSLEESFGVPCLDSFDRDFLHADGQERSRYSNRKTGILTFEEGEEYMAAAKRPWGVTLLSVLSFISVGSYLVLTVLAVAFPGALRSLLEGLSPQGSGPEVLLNMGRL